MAGSKSRRPSPTLVNSWIKAGFGQGEGKNYKPFVHVRDVPSRGTSNVVRSRMTGRIHEYLSNHEFRVHLLAEYGRTTLDIRERFALLPWDETQTIAARLGIQHPMIPGTRTPIVMTTDLLLSLKRPNGLELLAVSATLKEDFTARNLEKLLLERLYWNRRGVRWILATEENVPAARASNLIFFQTALNDDRAAKSGIAPADFSLNFEKHWSPTTSFNDVMNKTINSMGVDVHTGHALLGMAVWTRVSRINIDTDKLTHRGTFTLAG